MSEFNEWKLKEERKSKAHFVQNSSAKIYGSVKHLYYYCNQSGHYKPKGHGHFSVKENVEVVTLVLHISKQWKTHLTLVVEYCSTHTGHEIQLSHLPILDDVRLLIAIKLQEGVCVTQILDDVRDKCLDDNNDIGREQLVTRQDILNIGRKQNVHTIQKHSNDLLNVCSWVEEMKYNPILVFKPQGEEWE